MTEIELSYLAGIIDGEGCISIIKHSKNGQGYKSSRYRLRLFINNTSWPLIEWLNTQGFYILGHSTFTGKGKECYRAILMDRKAANLLKEILPYLIVKYEEALVAIEFQNHKDEIGTSMGCKGLTVEQLEYRESLKTRLHELKN